VLKNLHTTPDSGLTDTNYSTLADSRSCGLQCRSFGHVWVHPWSYRHVILYPFYTTKQTWSNLRAHVVHVNIEYVCFMFASLCKRGYCTIW